MKEKEGKKKMDEEGRKEEGKKKMDEEGIKEEGTKKNEEEEQLKKKGEKGKKRTGDEAKSKNAGQPLLQVIFVRPTDISFLFFILFLVLFV